MLSEDRIDSGVYEGSVAEHLVDVSQTAALLVVGKRRSELGSFMAGSVPFALAAHAYSPVVLVLQADDHTGAGQGIVVGVDGSNASQQACQLAADAAVRSGATLSILSTWSIPGAGAWTNSAWADGGTDPAWSDALRDAAAAVADTAAAAVRVSHPGLSVTIDLCQAPPAQALIQAGEAAALVVVGSRGGGGFASLVLGSVSHAVMHHCLSPVMVVR